MGFFIFLFFSSRSKTIWQYLADRETGKHDLYLTASNFTRKLTSELADRPHDTSSQPSVNQAEESDDRLL